MKKIINTLLFSSIFSAGVTAQSNNFPNGLFASKGTSAGGAAIFVGTTHASHFCYDVNEDTYIRGGKSGSAVIIGDVGSNVYLSNPSGGTYAQGFLQANNGLVGQKGTSAGGSAIFVGTTFASHFNYSTTEDTYIRGGKSTSNVILADVGNGVIIGQVSSVPAGYKLYVERGILTEKVKVAVKSTANWSDYVFDKKYKLMPLPDVEKYIAQNKHLPGIPSATEVVKEGIDLAEMNAKLLAKVEELTLHMIAMQKEITALKKENTKNNIVNKSNNRR